MGAFTRPTTPRPFAATALPDKPSALSQRLIKEGCEKARSYRTLAQLLDEHREMLAALKELHQKTVIGTDAERHAALNHAWAIIAKVEAP